MLNKINTWLGRAPTAGDRIEPSVQTDAVQTPALSEAPTYGAPEASAPPTIANSASVVQSSDPRVVELLGSMPAASGYAVTETSAMRVSTVYACTRLIAGTIGGLPVEIYERIPTGRELVVESPYWYLLNEEPCANWTAMTMWEWVTKCQILRGDGYVEILRDRKGEVVGLLPHHPDRVHPRLVSGRLRYSVFPFDGEPYGRDQDDMLHFAGFGFDGVRSMSVLQYAAFQAVGIALAADGFSGKFFTNGATPKHLITAQGKINEDQVEELRRMYAERYTGPENAGKPMVLTQGLDIKELSLSAVDAELLESRKYQVVDICRAMGVPPVMVGAQDTTSSWGSGVEHMTLGFVKFTCQPFLTRNQQELNRKLFRTPKLFVEHNLGALLRGDAKSEADYFRQALGGSQGPGWMTANEIRRIKNLPPVDGGDKLYEPKNGNSNAQTPPPADS
jgi:HK97 family phage portal protein